jgi:hypothetical protein
MPTSQRHAGCRDKRRRGGSECGRRDAREVRTEPANERGRVGLSRELGAHLFVHTFDELLQHRG